MPNAPGLVMIVLRLGIELPVFAKVLGFSAVGRFATTLPLSGRALTINAFIE